MICTDGAADSLPGLAAAINKEHELFLEHGNSTLQHAVRTGQLLLEAKVKCQHGEWEGWLKRNVQFAVRTAQAYMRLAGKQGTLQAKAQPVALLGFKDALEILAEGKGDGETARTKRLCHITANTVPEVSKAVKDGKLKLADAERLIDQPTTLQRKAIHDVTIGRAKTVREVLQRNETPPVDAKGVELPENVRDWFASKTIPSIITDLSAGIRDLRDNARENVWLHLEKAVACLEDARAHLENGVPHAVHPKCGGKGCADCRHAGWVPQTLLLELETTGRWQ